MKQKLIYLALFSFVLIVFSCTSSNKSNCEEVEDNSKLVVTTLVRDKMTYLLIRDRYTHGLVSRNLTLERVQLDLITLQLAELKQRQVNNEKYKR